MTRNHQRPEAEDRRQRRLVGLGFILSLGVGTCMLTSLVFLPAVLNLRSRRASQPGAEALATTSVAELQRQAA